MTLFKQLQSILENTFDDQKIDAKEKADLFEVFQPLTDDQRAFVRNKAFDMVQEFSRTHDGQPPFKWLEQVIKSLDNSEPKAIQCSVVFSPGEDCLNALLSLIRSSKKSLQICVFTISDNRIRDALIDAHQRGVDIRIITDNDKTEDQGSDIETLAYKGLSVRVDNTRHHMHHKFVVVDEKVLATGSFNWTLSASKYNHENILQINDTKVIADFVEEFEKLWLDFSSPY